MLSKTTRVTAGTAWKIEMRLEFETADLPYARYDDVRADVNDKMLMLIGQDTEVIDEDNERNRRRLCGAHIHWKFAPIKDCPNNRLILLITVIPDYEMDETLAVYGELFWVWSELMIPLSMTVKLVEL